jgi:Fic family protein
MTTTKNGSERKAEQWKTLLAVVARFAAQGARLQDIQPDINGLLPKRTLQYRLKRGVELGYLRKTGVQRGVRYFVADDKAMAEPDVHLSKIEHTLEGALPFSADALAVLAEIRKPLMQRKPVAYQHAFLDGYRPNVSRYLSQSEQSHLATIGAGVSDEPAGTFVRQIFNRLLIDLSWNSSRLEGNTYSLLETRRLIQFGTAANTKASLETQMILNHKDAIEFLVDGADELGFNRYTLLNLHALLSNNLLADPDASGRLRKIAVGIGKSVFQPLELPQRIAEYFDQLLAKAQAISNPFEQALFALVQLPYLQAFDDVNKRVSRLAANIPLIKHNLIPLSFIDLPKDSYTEAVLAVYELNRIEPVKDIFIWAYERSAAYYKVVRQTLGEPDAFRLRFRDELKSVVTLVVTERLDRPASLQRMEQWVQEHIPEPNRAEFQEKAELELLSLHEGNIARYRIRPSAFNAWQRVWSPGVGD